jgi:type II secretory pathway component PulK
MKDPASWIAIGAALISACVGLYAAAGSDVRDKLIPQIGAQSSWAAWAAIAAAVSVVAQAMEKLPN